MVSTKLNTYSFTVQWGLVIEPYPYRRVQFNVTYLLSGQKAGPIMSFVNVECKINEGLFDKYEHTHHYIILGSTVL